MKARNIGSWARSSFLAMAAVMLCLAAAYPEEPGGIESLLDRYPRGWGSKQRQAKVWAAWVGSLK